MTHASVFVVALFKLIYPSNISRSDRVLESFSSLEQKDRVLFVSVVAVACRLFGIIFFPLIFRVSGHCALSSFSSLDSPIHLYLGDVKVPFAYYKGLCKVQGSGLVEVSRERVGLLF
jgi:hypothetical protein